MRFEKIQRAFLCLRRYDTDDRPDIRMCQQHGLDRRFVGLRTGDLVGLVHAKHTGRAGIVLGFPLGFVLTQQAEE